MPKTENESVRLANAGIVVKFDLDGDRYRHSVQSGLTRFRSTEASGVETPVFTEVHVQGDVAFLSGMSGDRHWSMAVEPIEGGYAFDVACRVKSPAPTLGAAYDLAQPDGLHLIGKQSDGTAPCTFKTIDNLVRIDPPPATTEPPCTRRFKYAVVRTDSRWMERRVGGAE